MASLKEIKGRIASVKSTQKITSAMKMVASAKLRKAQQQIDRFLPYQHKLDEMLHSFLSAASEEFETNLAEQRVIKRVAIVVFSSNSSLCGAFNSNVIRLLRETISKYQPICNSIEVYPVGKKVEDYIRKAKLSTVEVKESNIDLMDKPNFGGAKEIAEQLINDFLHNKVDQVVVLYNHFKSAGVQVPTNEIYLPVTLEEKQDSDKVIQTDYLIEPDREAILSSLIPKSLHSKIYAALLDSAAAEQAARVVAMQVATDNAGDLLDELTIQFNKQRQQAITSELLDIIGGSEALK